MIENINSHIIACQIKNKKFSGRNLVNLNDCLAEPHLNRKYKLPENCLQEKKIKNISRLILVTLNEFVRYFEILVIYYFINILYYININVISQK